MYIRQREVQCLMPLCSIRSRLSYLGDQSPFSLRNTNMILRPVRLLHSPVVFNQTSVQDISLCSGIVSPLPFQVSNGCLSLLASVESMPGTSVPSIETCPELRLPSVE
jgi:hypothetical protein